MENECPAIRPEKSSSYLRIGSDPDNATEGHNRTVPAPKDSTLETRSNSDLSGSRSPYDARFSCDREDWVLPSIDQPYSGSLRDILDDAEKFFKRIWAIRKTWHEIEQPCQLLIGQYPSIPNLSTSRCGSVPRHTS